MEQLRQLNDAPAIDEVNRVNDEEAANGSCNGSLSGLNNTPPCSHMIEEMSRADASDSVVQNEEKNDESELVIRRQLLSSWRSESSESSRSDGMPDDTECWINKVNNVSCIQHATEKSTLLCLTHPSPSGSFRKRVLMEEIAPRSDEIRGIHDSSRKNWRVSIDAFTSKRHGKQKGDNKLSRRVRQYYKNQDDLINEFEIATLEIRDEVDEDNVKVWWCSAVTLAKISFFTNLALIIAKCAAAIISGSLSVISSVIDSAVDLVAGVLIWWSNRAVKRRNPYTYPQGRTKLEPVSIVILSVIMALASVQMIRESIEKIIRYATSDIAGPNMTPIAISISSATVVIKLILYVICRKARYVSASVQALAQDHRNDILSNTIAVLGGVAGDRLWHFADPLGAIIISLYIVINWTVTGWEQIKFLTGHTAQPEFLKKITWIALNHHEKIREIDTVRAFHFGNNFLVEVDIVLPEWTVLREAHDIGEALQLRIEKLSEVERAFVHIDYESTHNPNSEHKVV